MHTLGTRLLAVAVALGAPATLRAADAPPDLADLRDAVRAAAKKGNNVGEIAKAVDALEKALAGGFVAPKPGTPIPPELTAVRDAVEAAARKGENVDGIRTELEAVEKAVTGRVLDRPKPPPPADPPVRPRDPFRPDVFPRPLPFPVLPNAGPNAEEMQKAQDLMRKALELLVQNGNDADARKLLEEAREMMLKAIAGQGGIPNFPAFPELNLPDAAGRGPGKFRLGVRLEPLTPVLVEQLGLEAGRGVVLAEVIEGSPADKAGLRANDIVIEFAGKPVTDVPADFTAQVNAAKGGKVDAVVLRKGKKVELKGIELPDAPAAPRRPAVRPVVPLPVLPGLPGGLPGVNGRNAAGDTK
ncbi:MAG: hypothetical protein C0501_17260 [Isosphaera sp.]|nr:hypothetical protein [Isosphaera sp.]